MASGGDFVLLCDKTGGAVHAPQFGLFDLACGIARNFRENYPARTLVSRQIETVRRKFLFGQSHTVLDGHDGRGDFSEPRVRQPYDGNILYRSVRTQKVFDLDGIKVFSARDDDILRAVDEINESVALLRHIAREKPSVLFKDFSRRFRILVIFLENARAFEGELSDFAGGDGSDAVLCDDLRLR